MTPSGIEPANFRFVAQHLNHFWGYVDKKYLRYINEATFLRSLFCSLSVLIFSIDVVTQTPFLFITLSILIPVHQK